MSVDAIKILRTEHANMRRVLALVNDLLDAVEAGQTPNFVLLANALYYMRRFPSQVHHPKEDLIFRLLYARDPRLDVPSELQRHLQETVADSDGRIVAGWLGR